MEHQKLVKDASSVIVLQDHANALNMKLASGRIGYSVSVTHKTGRLPNVWIGNVVYDVDRDAFSLGGGQNWSRKHSIHQSCSPGYAVWRNVFGGDGESMSGGMDTRCAD